MDAGQKTLASIDSIISTNTNYDTEYYDDNYPDELCDMKAKDPIKFGEIINPVFFSAVVVFSLVGNILVVVILAKYENLRTLHNALILNLAVSDLIFTVGLPFWAYYHMYGWDLGEMACKIVSFIFYVGFYSSGVLVMMMTLHRYVSVVSPLSDLVTSKGFFSALASVSIWTLGILAAAPALIFSKIVDGNHCYYGDKYWKLFGIYQQNIIFLVTFVIVCFCYTHILRRLVRSPAQRRRHRTLKLIFILVLVFFVSWAPYNVITFLQTFDAVQKGCDSYITLGYAFYASRLIAYSHCCLNPVFYVFVGVKFKNHLKRMMRRSAGQRDRFRSRSSRLTITSLTSGEELSL